ncbi:GspH/FimT family pseudopilin [Acinetobacter sp. ANC 4173]|uniref:GspH/FimT family pseudopilin n=1 Tax=Acinetobacter sp. ANC 4173 TaxID=2529837 RepID=UPI00103A0D12|nr:GspH/FimT family pseudopilin [Acinetobacter sp. ANC 4173]TCB81033.1 prepilin-type N-terminal cleavage/methylation domain-containing protein [Acinetobacter sp. ANC 4173]
MRTNRGFTLIELIVTIVVLAIIATMAVPSFSNILLKQNLKKSTQELADVMVQARSKAALERREVTVQLNTSAVADSLTQLNWMPEGKAVLKTGSPTSITFLASGLIKNATMDTSFTICEKASGELSRTVSISRMGTIQQIVEGTCS